VVVSVTNVPPEPALAPYDAAFNLLEEKLVEARVPILAPRLVPPVLVKTTCSIRMEPPALKKYRVASTPLPNVIVNVIVPVADTPAAAFKVVDLVDDVVVPVVAALRRLVAAVETADVSVDKNVTVVPAVGALIPDPLPLWCILAEFNVLTKLAQLVAATVPLTDTLLTAV
jgi:hypothetical protein